MHDIAASLPEDLRDRLVEVVVRFMRTPSFLVRAVPDLSPDLEPEGLLAGFDWQDASGRSLADKVAALSSNLEQMVDLEREALMEALAKIQTGGITATVDDFDASELARREVLMPNVRLANGGVHADTRRRLMLAFNSPFFPEVLVASSVMSEGVDLHHDCRHIIHHDLDWNPSTLEQRIGRLDRLGSKAEHAGEPVVIYEPFLAGTHDEKMFRIVKDRERWFGVVMGESGALDERSSERIADRVPLPPEIARTLTMDLSLKTDS